MISMKEVPGTNILELTVDGPVTANEFDTVIERMEAAIAHHGEIQVLKHVVAIGTVPVSKWWDDIDFAWHHLKDVRRLAVVCDKAWLEAISKLFTPFVPCEVRYFSSAEIDMAREWLRQPVEV